MSEDLSRPNAELNEQDKVSKRHLKKLLKRQIRGRKLRVRLSQAITRKEPQIVERTRIELDIYLKEEAAAAALLECPFNASFPGQADIEAISCPEHLAARNFVVSMYHELNVHLQDNNQEVVNNKSSQEMKEFQTDQARTLLRKMTKGEQTESMFDNEAALRGYTRQKFIERAMLVVTSLNGLETTNRSLAQTAVMVASTNTNNNNVQEKLRQEIRERLLSVRSVCSVGCGPGCDAVGVAAWLTAVQSKSDTNVTTTKRPTTVLDYAVLLDWTMPQWEQIVGPLKKVLVQTNVVGDIATASCDVRSSLVTANDNAVALGLLTTRTRNGSVVVNGGHKPGTSRLQVDLVITSYLLSETRGLWHVFFDDMVQWSAPGTIFLFTDPTAWQLHEFRERAESSMDFCWLDSSIHRPELQALERRVGPAVLIGIKRG